MPPEGVVTGYLVAGLRLGRHIDGLVDAYYGPPRLAAAVEAEPPRAPGAIAAELRSLIAALDAGKPLDGPAGAAWPDRPAGGSDHRGGSGGSGVPGVDVASRRAWVRAQLVGLLTTARRLAGDLIPYADEVELCYGVRPVRVPEDTVMEAHRLLEEVLPGSGDLRTRLVTWRESHAIPVDRLGTVIGALAEVLRHRTAELFGLPEGESVSFELVHDQPWSGFNYYRGDLRSDVAVNTDLPVLSTGIAHLVAHEAYPGHHTEHTRKEAGLVRGRRWMEESIFLVGTPQCLCAEGLADLGLEVVFGPRPEPAVAEVLAPLGVRYDAEVVAAVAQAGEALGAVRQLAAFRLHEDGADPETVVSEVARLGLLPRDRAAKSVEFLTHPTWRAYLTCYVEGLPLCRRFVSGDPRRFERLLTEQLTPADLQAAILG